MGRKSQKLKLRDSDIRTRLIKHLASLYSKDPNTRILGELNLCEGNVRIDIAVVNSVLIGYEIKSDSDTLERLPYQQEIYSQIFNRVIIVIGKNHLDKAMNLIPSWWGIWIVDKEGKKIHFDVFREPKDNTNINPFSLAKCLWRDEVLNVLRDKKLANGLERAKRSVLREELAKNLPCKEINAIVCSYLKSRSDWSIVLTPE